MANINTLKVVLVEKGKKEDGSLMSLENLIVPLANGAVIAFNQTFRLWIKYQNC